MPALGLYPFFQFSAGIPQSQDTGRDFQYPGFVKRPVPEIRADGLADGLVVFNQNAFNGFEEPQPLFQGNLRLFQAGPGLKIENSQRLGIRFRCRWHRLGHGNFLSKIGLFPMRICFCMTLWHQMYSIFKLFPEPHL
jgi:hypothetical protein